MLLKGSLCRPKVFFEFNVKLKMEFISRYNKMMSVQICVYLELVLCKGILYSYCYNTLKVVIIVVG